MRFSAVSADVEEIWRKLLMMLAIDTHTHLVPRDFPALPLHVSARGWPTMIAAEDGRARMVIDGADFRVFDSEYWDVGKRLAIMDRDGIDMQVLSPLPELLGYWLEPETTAALAAHMHQSIAATIAVAPTRFAGIGMLPLQDISLSLQVLDEAADLGMRGFLVASNINGVSIADARFDPIFAAILRRRLTMVVHGYRPAGTERMIGSPLLSAIIGVPQDTMAAIASFILRDILGAFPGLKLCFVQGGGTFGSIVERFDHTWEKFAQLRELVAIKPSEYARQFYFDTVTFGPRYLRYLIEVFGGDALVAGTDGPSAAGQPDMCEFIESVCTEDHELAEKLLWRNAVRLFGLDVTGLMLRPNAKDPIFA